MEHFDRSHDRVDGGVPSKGPWYVFASNDCLATACANNRLVFAQMLNEMRLGHIGDETVKAFRGMARPLNAEGGIEVTELYVLPFRLISKSTDMMLVSQHEMRSSNPIREDFESFPANLTGTRPWIRDQRIHQFARSYCPT